MFIFCRVEELIEKAKQKFIILKTIKKMIKGKETKIHRKEISVKYFNLSWL